MKSKGFLIIIFVIILIGASIYAYLGGFSQPEIKQTQTEKVYIIGKAYQGSIKGPELGMLFEQAGELVGEGMVAGDLGNVFYNDPEKHKDSINAFIGIIVPDANVSLPAGYELRTLPAGIPVLQVRLEAHYMLAPGKMYTALKEYASEQKLTLQDVFIERYNNTQEAIVQAYLEEPSGK